MKPTHMNVLPPDELYIAVEYVLDQLFGNDPRNIWAALREADRNRTGKPTADAIFWTLRRGRRNAPRELVEIAARVLAVEGGIDSLAALTLYWVRQRIGIPPHKESMLLNIVSHKGGGWTLVTHADYAQTPPQPGPWSDRDMSPVICPFCLAHIGRLEDGASAQLFSKWNSASDLEVALTVVGCRSCMNHAADKVTATA